ncbi:MAG: hypothetical protein LBN40_04900 [Oscillospiraceae bacterium]|jgi:hypothetical protein|nr:hypothetical protein [Oscillospiraceae bacterium]
MNIIPCSEKCRHCDNGYCALTAGAQVTNAVGAGCRYYESVSNTQYDLNTTVSH